MNQYQYQPLDTAKDEIRLIRLLPGSFSDDIEIEIFHTRLRSNEKDEENEPGKKRSKSRKIWDSIMHSKKLEDALSYEALSYVWGSEDNPSFVSVRNIKQSTQPRSWQLPVTRNLGEALRYLRKEDEARILWVDAVCINQQDLGERSAQVSKMGDIYRNAAQVDVWLGTEAKDSDVAIDLVHSISSDLVTTDEKDRPVSDIQYTVWPGTDTAKLLANPVRFKPGFKALRNLCQREWFTRLWIYQEYQLSKVAIGIIGGRTLDLRILYKVLSFLYNNPMGEYRSGSIDNARVLLQPIPRLVSAPFLTLALRNSFCSDERDRVYAMLSLLDSEYTARISPDYTKTVQDVNKAFFLCLLNVQAEVDFWASRDEHESTSSSWIPNLYQISSSNYSNASGYSCHEITYESKDESLRLPANPVGVISSIWFTVPRSLDFRDLPDLLRAYAQPPTNNQTYVHGGTWLDAYVATLARGRYREVTGVPRYPTLQELRDTIQCGILSKETVIARSKVAFRGIRGRTFCSTTNGLIGICPPSARIGDKIYVTLGVATPILVSSVEGHPNHYRLKGECYVHGLMNSEALLGQFPATATEDVWSYQLQLVQGVNMVIFTSGPVITQNDPRLGALPAEWRKVYLCQSDGRYYDTEHGQDGKIRKLKFENLQTRERTLYDPRLTSAALRARGVVFEHIAIV
ncbi:HET-domain-containing protein [Hyaloscypha variabilis F]|uniref:HET-domain-containing protein n=1 Tax=Hyaloscypha variabilis (strain UAMH 11265 / GT02V1 / F) TaxID=1149755 RepID=A0A2J6QWP3_HYAVF|nr:HET-domain-containing protein [Hyaloscypha variabilis F]